MKLDLTQLEASFFVAQKTLGKQNLPDFMKDRWWRALEKAKVKLIEQPFFSWHPNALTIVSIPHQKKDKSFCSFYQVTGETCNRLDKSGYCQAFYEGFPCWHRGAFLLLGIYFDYFGKGLLENPFPAQLSTKTVNQSC